MKIIDRLNKLEGSKMKKLIKWLKENIDIDLKNYLESGEKI